MVYQSSLCNLPPYDRLHPSDERPRGKICMFVYHRQYVCGSACYNTPGMTLLGPGRPFCMPNEAPPWTPVEARDVG
eukprot:6189823-Pleurochrysis_carterae.AAC.2